MPKSKITTGKIVKSKSPVANKVKTASTATKLPVKRVKEISDSLSKSGYNKIAASVSERTFPADKLKELTKSGWSDVDKSKRLQLLVNKNTKKK